MSPGGPSRERLTPPSPPSPPGAETLRPRQPEARTPRAAPRRRCRRPDWETGLIFEFSKSTDMKRWRAFDDRAFGGLSEARIGVTTEGGETFLRFEGTLSYDIPDEAHWLDRSGIAGFNWSAADERHCLDLDTVAGRVGSCRQFDVVEFLVRPHGPGKAYVANLRSDNWAEGRKGTEMDLWQARLATPGPGQWGWARADTADFVQTRRGRLTASQQPVYRQRVMALGVSLAGGSLENEGPFCLDLRAVRGAESGRLGNSAVTGREGVLGADERGAFGARGVPGRSRGGGGRGDRESDWAPHVAPDELEALEDRRSRRW